jgi:hypothetical protein
MTLMVALVGGQSLPNLLPVRHYHPESTLLIYSKRTQGVYERLKAVLQQETQVYGLETDAYDIPDIVEKFNEVLESPPLAAHPLLVNLTGGTKPMSLAAYQVAQQRNAPMIYLESERKRIFMYHYTWAGQELQSASPEMLAEYIRLQDFFDVQLGVNKWSQQHPPSNDGGYFELALADALRSHGYEIMTSVKAMGSQVDIDIAVCYENQFGILEAKLGKQGKNLHGIQQLSTNGQFLGIYTRRFYVITVNSSYSHEEISKAANIQIISLPGYDEQTHTLSEDDVKTFIGEIDKAFKE